MIKRFALVGRTSFGMCNVYSEMTSKARVSLQRVCVRVYVLCVDENSRGKIKTYQQQQEKQQQHKNTEIHRYLMVVRLLLLLQPLVLLPLVVVVIPLSRQFLCVPKCSRLFYRFCYNRRRHRHCRRRRRCCYIYIIEYLCMLDCCCCCFFCLPATP